MAAGPITSWQIDGERMETVTDFIFLGSKITADGDCSHEIKSHLLLGRKVMTHLDSILKSRDITLPTKVHLVKAMVFPVVMYGYESWTIKKAERQRVDSFELWCWRRLLRAPWTARRSNQSILKEINPEYTLERVMLKLKLQYFGSPDAKSWLTGKNSEAGKDWGQEQKAETGDEMVGWHHWLSGHDLSELQETVKDREAWRTAVCWVAESDTTERLNNKIINQYPSPAGQELVINICQHTTGEAHYCGHYNKPALLWARSHLPAMWILDYNFWSLASKNHSH